MSGRHAAPLAAGAGLALVALTLLAGGGPGPVALAVVGVLLLVGALISGFPVLVVLAALAQVGSVAWTVGRVGEWSAVVAAAPLVRVGTEAGWRWFELGHRVVADRRATASWAGATAAIAVATAAFALLVLALTRTTGARGLTFHALGVLAVAATAGALTLLATRRTPTP